jgi:hypothetical protein
LEEVEELRKLRKSDWKEKGKESKGGGADSARIMSMVLIDDS